MFLGDSVAGDESGRAGWNGDRRGARDEAEEATSGVVVVGRAAQACASSRLESRRIPKRSTPLRPRHGSHASVSPDWPPVPNFPLRFLTRAHWTHAFTVRRQEVPRARFAHSQETRQVCLLAEDSYHWWYPSPRTIDIVGRKSLRTTRCRCNGLLSSLGLRVPESEEIISKYPCGRWMSKSE